MGCPTVLNIHRHTRRHHRLLNAHSLSRLQAEVRHERHLHRGGQCPLRDHLRFWFLHSAEKLARVHGGGGRSLTYAARGRRQVHPHRGCGKTRNRENHGRDLVGTGVRADPDGRDFLEYFRLHRRLVVGLLLRRGSVLSTNLSRVLLLH